MSKPKKKTQVAASGRLGEPRLIIKKLVLENFKSYAGVQEIGPFHKCFSSIVGPNGSGKSNVIDALLFVFGRRATKIRLKKISELIHNSSGRNLTECKVSVYFCDIIDRLDDDDGYDVVPNSDIVISRTADKDSNSKYYLNGKLSNFTDVGALLRTKGVDLDNNRFLILQGEVEQIAMMKPKAQGPNQDGLLDYMEDIIGSNKYVEAIEEGFQQVERLNELRQEKLNRVKLVEKEKDGLEGAKSEAEAYLLKETELNSKYAALNQLYQHESLKHASEAEAKRAEVHAKLTLERKKLSETTKKLTVKEEEFAEKKKQFDEIGEELAKTKTEFSAYERRDIKLREDMKHESGQKKKFKAKAKTITDTQQELKDKLTRMESDTPALEEQLEKLQAMKAEADRDTDKLMEAVKGKTEPIRLELETKQKELIPLRKVVNEKQLGASVCEEELKIFEEKTQTAKVQYDDTRQKLDSHDDRVNEAKSKVKAAEASAIKQEARLTEVQTQLTNLGTQESKLDEERRDLRSKLAECKEALSSSASKNELVTALMAEKHRFTGLHGRLGDLGTIDAKYDVAITTACPSLNNILVEDTTNAGKCIEFLRQHKLGRATFTVMDKITHLQSKAESSMETPEGVPRLYDLVKPKNAIFRIAFYSVLGNTLVAKDMDQAVRIAYGAERHRVVTLDGQLIDTSGTMSGGGNQVRRGGMSGKQVTEGQYSAKDAAQFERQLAEVEKKREEVLKQKRELEAEVKSLTVALSQTKVEVKKLNIGVQNLHAQKSQLQARLSELEDSLKLTPAEEKRATELRHDMERHNKELAAAKKGASKLEELIEALQKKMMDAGGAQLKTQKQKAEDLGKKVDETSKEITTNKVELSSGEKRLAKMDKEISENEASAEKSEERLTKLKAEFKQLEEDASKVHAAFKDATKLQEQKEAELEAIQQEYEDFKKVVDAVRGVEVDLTARMDDFARIVADNNLKANHWGQKLTDLEAKIAESESLIDDEPTEVKMHVGEDDEKKEPTQKRARYARLSEEEVGELKKDELQYSITMLEESLKLMKPNMKAIAEYRKKEQEYSSRVSQLDETTQERDEARKNYEGLRKKRLDEFMAGFSVITMKLKEMYQMLTLGGDAELELVDSLDPFSEGIVFSVRPPKKSWKNIQNLSGGEKTLSSLALVFALHHFKPTPLYVMDEIDAALDYKNVSIVANYIKERTKDAQFVIISLRNNMFELADRLVGIYKTDNATKSISIDPRRFCMETAPTASTSTDSPPSTTS